MTTEENAAIGKRLKNLRTGKESDKSRFITQAYIAEVVLNVSKSLYCKIEKGKAPLVIDHAKALAEFYGVSIDFIYHGNNEDLISAMRQYYGTLQPPDPATMTAKSRREYLEAVRFRKLQQAIQASIQMVKIESTGQKKKCSEIAQNVFVNGESYVISPEKLPEIMRATIEIARSSFCSLCRTNNLDHLTTRGNERFSAHEIAHETTEMP